MFVENIDTIEINIFEKNLVESLDKKEIKQIKIFVKIIFSSKDLIQILQFTNYNSLESNISNNRCTVLETIDIIKKFKSKI